MMPAAVRGQDPARGLADDDSRAFLTLLPLLNPAPGRPFLFFLDQKNAAVTLVSASGGFSYLCLLMGLRKLYLENRAKPSGLGCATI